MNNKSQTSTQTHSTACILCSRNCGITVNVEDGKFNKIKGDPAHPMTNGYICQKAARLDHYQNHDDRLGHPLKKMPDGTFQRVSWDQALSEIAVKLLKIKKEFGGDAFAFVGGGGQGNHIGGAYAQQILRAMGSRYRYTALAQEKTMDFWINGRLFGDQRVHCTEDVEHSDYVLFIGCNPFQAHGIPNARDTLKHLKKDPERTMVVVDPRVSETAKMADVHLQVKPGMDAYLMSAMVAIIVREGLHDEAFLTQKCTGFEELEKVLLTIPIEEFAQKADLPLDMVKKVARDFASAKRGCVRIDLGLQQTLHSTLTAYLEKMLYLVTGNFGRQGVNNLHTLFLPLLTNTDERSKDLKLTAHHKMLPISGMYPPNILPDEIEHGGEDRVRSVWVDSSNPVMTMADTKAYKRAFGRLDLLVVVDVAMTETARLADYILPAASQFEKGEATGFNAEFPENFFHFRHGFLPPFENSLPEPEIYSRLLAKMGLIPEKFPALEKAAKYGSSMGYQPYLMSLMASVKINKEWAPYGASILYRTLGKMLPRGAESGALILPLAIDYASKHSAAVKRTGIEGNKYTLGGNLFDAIIERKSGTIVSKHEFNDLWTFIKNKDGKIHLNIEKALNEMLHLRHAEDLTGDYPFILMAGERRSYNANQIFRNPAWRKVDKQGALRIHSKDAKELELSDGDIARVKSQTGYQDVTVDIDDSVRLGMVTLPHGYGYKYRGGEQDGPALNELTSGSHCDPFTKTPYHKYVPVHLEKVAANS